RYIYSIFFFFSSRRRHTRFSRDWSSDVCSSDLPGLRSLQFGDSLKQLLDALRLCREDLEMLHGKRVPLAIKIAPDMTDEETALVGEAVFQAGMDAIIATNTTLSREGVAGLAHADEAGGLS